MYMLQTFYDQFYEMYNPKSVIASIIEFKQGQTTDREMHYFYGARAIDEVFFLEDFLELEKDFPNFHFHLALDRPDPKADALGVKYTPGFIAPVMGDTYLKQHDAPEDIEYYLCGPPMMSKTVLDLLHSLGVEDDMIMFDNFGGCAKVRRSNFGGICEQIHRIFSQRRRPNFGG